MSYPRCDQAGHERRPKAEGGTRCATCAATSRRALAKRTGGRSYRQKHLKVAFGITLAEYDEMAERQGHVCAICGEPERRHHGKLSVDHDHATGRVRGLLCNACNVALGRMDDDPDRLEKAAAYLRGGSDGGE